MPLTIVKSTARVIVTTKITPARSLWGEACTAASTLHWNGNFFLRPELGLFE